MPQTSEDLARQFGGKSVTDLAAQFGGKPVSDTPEAPKGDLARLITGQPAQQPSGITLNDFVEFGKGVVKAPFAVIEAGGKLLRQIPGVDAMSKAIGEVEVGPASTAPSNTAQSVGRFAGDVATAFMPAGLVTKGAKALSTMAPRGLGMLSRGATEAAGAGAIAAAQGYDPTLSAVVGGTLGTAAGAAGNIASKLKKGADASMIAALGPAGRGSGPAGTNALEQAKKAAPELLRRNFKATSHEGALIKIGETLDAAGEKIDAIMGALPPGTRVQTKPIVETMKTLRQQNQIRGVAVGAGKVYNQVVDEFLKDLKQIGPSMTPEEAIRMRQKIGPLARWSKLVGNEDNIKSEAYKDIYNGVRTSIEGLDQNIRAANQDMAFWLRVRDILESSSRRPQAPSSGTSGAALATMASLAHGGPGVWGTIGIAAAGRQMQRLMRSPGWRFVSANVKDDLADALMKRDMGRFNQLAALALAQPAQEQP